MSLALEHVSLDEPGRRAQTRLCRLLRPVSQQWTARVPALGIVIYIKSPDKPRLTPHHEPPRRGTTRLARSLAHSRWNSLKSSSLRSGPAPRRTVKQIVDIFQKKKKKQSIYVVIKINKKLSENMVYSFFYRYNCTKSKEEKTDLLRRLSFNILVR